MNKLKNKQNLLLGISKNIFILFMVVSVFNIYGLKVSAEAIFNLMGVVKFTDGSSTQNGNASSPNSFAIAKSYRNNINSNFVVSNKPTNGKIYPAGYADASDPAYFLFDVGSSAWNPAPQVGDDAVTVLETYSGLNGWSGASYVAGVKKTVSQNDLNANGLDYSSANAVMEAIPTPTLDSATYSSITIGWTSLWDNNTGASGGAANNTIVGYSVYRSDNGGSYQLIGATEQNAGQHVTYTDNSVTLGHNYTYKLKVRFDWDAHSPNYLESSAEGAASAQLSPVIPNPDRLAFTTGEQTIVAGTKSNIITIQTRDAGGNDTPVQYDTTISLSSNSGGANKLFYSAANGLCTSTVINNVFIPSGSSTASFCYYDELTSVDGWTITAHKTNPPEGNWIDATQKIIVNSAELASFTLNLSSPQNNKIAFAGTNTLTALDQFGNVKTDFNAQNDNITFSVEPIDGVLSGLNGTNSNQLNSNTDFVNGVADLSGRIKFSGIAGIHTFTATSVSGKTATSGNILINPASATHLSVVAPSNVTAGTQFNITSITALDEFDNVDTSFNGSRVVSYSGANNGPLGTSPVYTTSVSFSNGVSTTPLATILVKAETISLTVTVAGLSGISNAITVAPATASSFTVTAPLSATAGVSFNINPITAYDQYGNIDTNYTGTKTLAYSGPGTGPVSGTPLYTTEVTFENGSSITDLATTLVKKESTSITVTDGTISGTTANINVSAGQVGSIEYVSGNNQTAIINTFLAEPLVVSVKDLYGNPKNNYPVSFVVTKSNGFLSIETPLTSAEGLASNTFRLGSSAGTDSDEVQAQINGATGSPVVFKATATANNPTNLIVTAPNNATAGVAFNLALSMTDAEGNLITDFTGTKQIAYSGASNSDNNTAPTYVTDVEFTNGSATVPVTLVKAESAVLTLTIAADNLTGTSNPILVAASTTKNFAVTAPATVQSGVSFNIVSIKTIDQFGNLSTDYTGAKTLTYSGPTADPVSGSTPTYTTAVDFANSEATTVLATTLFKAETIAITVKDGTIEGISNQIVVTYADYVLYYVSGNNQTGVAGQALAQPIKVIVLDNQGNPALDKTVVFTVTNGGGSAATPNTVDAQTGEVSTVWTLGTTVGSQSITASVEGVSTTIIFNATAVADSAAAITVTPPAINTYVGYSTEEINVCLQDQFGNQVVTNLSRSVNLASSSTSGQFSIALTGPWGITKVDILTGQSCVKIYYKDNTAGTYTFTASGSGLTSATNTINVLPLVATTIVVSPNSFTINENNNQQLSAVVYDQFNQSMTNVTLVWEMANANAGAITQNGLYYPTHTAGTYNNAIKVSVGGVAAYSTPTVTAQPAPPVVVPPPPVTPQQPQITPTVPVTPTTPSVPTTPVVVEVDQGYFSDDQGTVDVTVEVPVVSILSPKQGSLILSNGHVAISGTSIPNQLVIVKDNQNNVLGSVTSDNNGYWKLFVSRNKFATDQGSVTATVYNTNVSTMPLTFDFKPRTFGEYLYDIIFNN